MFTLQRRKVKDKLDTLGKQLQSEFQAAGLELVMHLSDDHPSLWNKKKVDTQWLFFSRDTNAQKELSTIIDTEKTLAATLEDPTPLYRHIFLGASINENGLEVGIRLHHDAWVDRKNLLAILSNGDKSKQFIELCKSLSTEMGFGLHQTALTNVASIDESALAAFQQEFDTSSKGWMFFGTQISKEAAIEQGAGISETVLQTAKELVKVYQFIAWSPRNDALSIETIVRQKEQERQATHDELVQAQKEREQKHQEIVAQRQKDKADKKQEMLDEQAWREQERAKRRAAARARREKEVEAMQSGTAQAPARPKSLSHDSSANANAEPPENSTVAPSKDAAPEGNKSEKDTPSRDFRPREARSREARSRDRDARQRNARPGDSKRRERPETQRNRQDAKGRPNDRGRSSRPYTSAPKSAQPPKVSEERKADIQVGDRVMVMNGFLKDRKGIVQSIAEDGDLKVSFGMVSSRVMKKDVKGFGPSV